MTAGIIDAMGDKIIAGTPLKRAGQPGDMAGVAIYLASRAASFVTGVVIPVDGGITGAKPTL
jgi:NAD(P)-dependent dehydrogenase (short-subunit alcohol dehydrogenase family)